MQSRPPPTTNKRATSLASYKTVVPDSVSARTESTLHQVKQQQSNLTSVGCVRQSFGLPAGAPPEHTRHRSTFESITLGGHYSLHQSTSEHRGRIADIHFPAGGHNKQVLVRWYGIMQGNNYCGVEQLGQLASFIS